MKNTNNTISGVEIEGYASGGEGVARLDDDSPFKHNITEMMDGYINQWSAELLQYKAMFTIICAFNAEIYPDSIDSNGVNSYINRYARMEEAIDRCINNMLAFVPNDCRLAQANLIPNQPMLVSVGDGGTAIDFIMFINGGSITARLPVDMGVQTVRRMTVVVNGGATYHFGHLGDNDSHLYKLDSYPLVRVPCKSYWDPYMLPDQSYTRGSNHQADIHSIKQYPGGKWELFEGDNSVYSRFCNRSDNSGQMTFNEFMHKYTDDGADAINAQRWWDPDNIFLGFNNKVLIYMNAKMVKQFDSFDVYKIVNEPHRDVVGVE